MHGCLAHTRNLVVCIPGHLVLEDQDEAPPKDSGVTVKVCPLGKQVYHLGHLTEASRLLLNRQNKKAFANTQNGLEDRVQG